MSRLSVFLICLLVAVVAGGSAVAFNSPMPALKTGAVVACGTTPTIINPGGTDSTRSICVQNINAVAIYVGGVNVTTTTGHVVPAGSLTDPKTMCFDAHHGWCIVAAATADARITFGTAQ
jgi:predicted permease